MLGLDSLTETDSEPRKEEDTVLTDAMTRLECPVKHYAWGKDKDFSMVARMVADYAAQSDEQSYAELWMGTHVSGSARVAADGSLLSEHIELPFLFKVLSVKTSLSIQCHPDSATAQLLHRRRPDVYKDPHHKPEMAIALSPRFEAMCGFRKAQEIVHFCQTVSALRSIIPDEELDTFTRAVADNKKAAIESSLKEVWSIVMKTEPKKYQKAVSDLLDEIRLKPVTRLKSAVEERDMEVNALIVRLSVEYPLDIGILAVFFLNCLSLKRGESLFLCANLAHAYLSGDCLEAMAASDNVIRAGLTPKLRDTAVLCETLDYSKTSSDPSIRQLNDGLTLSYECPVAEFRVELTTIDEGAEGSEEMETGFVTGVTTLDLQKSDSHSVLFVYDGAATISDTRVRTGDVFLLNPGLEQLTVMADTKKGVKLARCFAPL